MKISAEKPEKRSGVTRRTALGGGLALTLTGCNSMGVQLQGMDLGKTAASLPPPAGGPLAGETLGSGPVRVGMILPLTQNGAPSPVGVSMRNAAQLAIDDFGGPYITLMIQDDHSSSDGAAQAAQSELSAGAQLILGPVFANDVRAAAPAAKSAGRPMIAFSTDVSVAMPGVYLLSFLIEGYVDRIIQYAASTGKKSFAIMAPQNDYGNVAAARFQEDAANFNAQVVVSARYSAGQPANRGARGRGGLRPDRRPVHSRAGRRHGCGCKRIGLKQLKTQLLGTGVWNSAGVLRLPQMQGAWFSAPDNSGFNALAQRYRAKFNSDPTRVASLAYDAVTLAAALAQNHDGGPLQCKDADRRIRLQRRRWRVPFPRGWNERARLGGNADRRRRRQGDQPRAEELRGGVKTCRVTRSKRRSPIRPTSFSRSWRT